jgi:hypothetical protein
MGHHGTIEKHLTLEIAQSAGERLVRLGHRVALTRTGDINLGLGERIRRARAERADAFISIHLNSSEDPGDCGFEIWLHDQDVAADNAALAECTRQALATMAPGQQRDASRGRLAVLDPNCRGGGAACLVELGYLSHPNESALFALEAHRSKVAGALAEGIHRFLRDVGRDARPTMGARTYVELYEQFDVWHEVPLVPQWTGMSCWAAAAAMIVGWRDCIEVDPEDIVRGSGQWEAYHHGLDPTDTGTLRRAWGLTEESVVTLTVPVLRQLLEDMGPLWVGEASPGLHVVVVAGVWGDGTPGGTFVRVADPWPEGKGERYNVSFADFARSFAAVGDLSGIQACILHAGGRSVGTALTSRVHQSRALTYTTEDEERRHSF